MGCLEEHGGSSSKALRMPEFTWKAAAVRLRYGLASWLKHGGPLGLLKWVVRDLSYYCWLYLTRSGWRERRFDSLFGVQTRQIVPLSQLTVSSPNVVQRIQHAPTRPRVLRSLLGRLDVDYTQFVFIDLGCGKGRAVLVAAEFPFKKIIGVEFAAELVRHARENVSEYLNPMRSAAKSFYCTWTPPTTRSRMRRR